MLVVAVVTVLPWASWTATCMAGVIPAPATALLGCTMNASFAAVGWTGPEVLPEHPPSPSPHSATPSQNPPRASTPARRLLSVLPAPPAQGLRGASDGSSCCWARGGLRRAIDRTLRDGGQSRHLSRPETQRLQSAPRTAAAISPPPFQGQTVAAAFPADSGGANGPPHARVAPWSGAIPTVPRTRTTHH